MMHLYHGLAPGLLVALIASPAMARSPSAITPVASARLTIMQDNDAYQIVAGPADPVSPKSSVATQRIGASLYVDARLLAWVHQDRGDAQ